MVKLPGEAAAKPLVCSTIVQRIYLCGAQSALSQASYGPPLSNMLCAYGQCYLAVTDFKLETFFKAVLSIFTTEAAAGQSAAALRRPDKQIESASVPALGLEWQLKSANKIKFI